MELAPPMPLFGRHGRGAELPLPGAPRFTARFERPSRQQVLISKGFRSQAVGGWVGAGRERERESCSMKPMNELALQSTTTRVN